MADTIEKDAAWHRDAAAIARSFLMMFNGALLYGCAHPNTAKNAEAFCELLNGSFGGGFDMLTIISNNGTFMIEDWPLDASFNARKVILHFEKLGLVSVSFERGVGADSVIRLIGLAGDIGNVEQGRAGLEEAKKTGSIPFIRINYVLYGKIKADEVIIKETDVFPAPAASPASGGLPNLTALAAKLGAPAVPDAAGQAVVLEEAVVSEISALSNMMGMAGASDISTGRLSSAAAARIEEVLTLSSLLERPREVSEALANAGADGKAEGLRAALGSLKREIAQTEGHSADELLESLFTLKQDLYEAIEVQKATGKIMRSAADAGGELDDLTCAAIVKLARDEYKSGRTPLKRLAHAIRRMMPSNAELTRVLPGLKEMLLAEGMNLADYLELIGMLGLEIESETLSDTLKDAASSVGATVNDLVAAIRSKPEEAARLILLASEVRGAGEDDGRLSDMLTGYIEEVCSKMAADACAAGGVQDGAALKKALAQFESRMFRQLVENKSVPEPVLANIRDRLAARFEEVLAAARPPLPRDAATAASTRQPGAAQTQVEGALNAGNLLFLINKEISRHARYNTPFATALISIERIADGGTVRAPQAQDAPELLPQLFKLAESLLRDVDLIGILDAAPVPELFTMLPMTDEAGAAIVRNRLVSKIKENVFTIKDRQLRVDARVSVTCPDEGTRTLKTFMVKVRGNHA